MEELAVNYQDNGITQEYGTITEQQENEFTVLTDTGTWQAKPAVSCILQPDIGDKVLLLAHPCQPAYILVVLERTTNSPAQLLFENDVTLRTKNGKLNIAASEGLNLVSNKNIDIISKELKVHSRQANIGIDKIFFWGDILESQLKSIRVFATTVDSVFKRFTQKIKRSYRTIEEVEHVKADRFICDANTLLSFKGKYSIVTAKEDMKIDGERIHIG